MILAHRSSQIRTALLACVAIVILLQMPVKAQESTDNILIDEAYITEIIVDYAEESVFVQGELGDSCTEIGDIEQSVEEDTIRITVQTKRPADAMCAMMLTTFEETIPLMTDGLMPGEYTVVVHDLTASFVIAAPEPIICSELMAEEGQELFQNEQICFLYPQEYMVVSNETLILISSTEIIEGQRISLVIQIEAEPEASNLEQIQTQLKEDHPEEELAFESAYLGAQEATYTDSIDEMRYLSAIHQDQLYTLILQPFSDQYPELQEASIEFWDALLTSWGFSADQSAE